MNTAQLIRRGRDLDVTIKADSKELKEIKVKLVELGKGEHLGTDGSRALVIFPAASIGAPDEDTLKVLRRLLTPSKFEKLFVEKRVFTPVGAFKDVAAALLDHDKAEEICDLLEKESAAQVRFS